MAVKLSFHELYFPSSPRSLKVWSVAEGDKGPREGRGRGEGIELYREREGWEI